MAVRKKRSISIPPELDAEFVIRAGLEAVGQYEAEHGPFTLDEIAEADDWAARATKPAAPPSR